MKDKGFYSGIQTQVCKGWATGRTRDSTLEYRLRCVRSSLFIWKEGGGGIQEEQGILPKDIESSK